MTEQINNTYPIINLLKNSSVKVLNRFLELYTKGDVNNKKKKKKQRRYINKIRK